MVLERDGGKLSKVRSRKSHHGWSVAVRDVVVDIVEDKIVILQNENGFSLALYMSLRSCQDSRLKFQGLIFGR